MTQSGLGAICSHEAGADKFQASSVHEKMQKDHNEKVSTPIAVLRSYRRKHCVIVLRVAYSSVGRVFWLRVLISKFCAAVREHGTLGVRKALPKIRIWTTPL